MGGTLYLVHEKLEDDIYKIELLAQRMKLSDDEKRKLRRAGVRQRDLSGVMMVGGVVAARVGASVEPGSGRCVNRARFRQQADLMELEGLPRGYPTLQDRNVLDAQGELTPTGRDLVDSVVPGASEASYAGRHRAPDAATACDARPAVEFAGPAESRRLSLPSRGHRRAGVRRPKFVPSPLREQRERGTSRPRRQRARRRDRARSRRRGRPRKVAPGSAQA